MRIVQAPGLAGLAVSALQREAWLTPKPGLVDGRGSGAHTDMDLLMLLTSAEALQPFFAEIADATASSASDLALREELGALGRRAEAAMLAATGGVNTHRGALWTLGLLVAGAVGARLRKAWRSLRAPPSWPGCPIASPGERPPLTVSW